ncbi:GNAT family N-acetyltransferase [Sutcliffiella rhizosphaerae]|uniref:N-acetyltransferase domain-containing protein n=1 Tax=Sutcliffiella rhizosphaerae TaxID=2880967 RepID=A0ABN8A9J5_9BACI|nr:GNAT family N-acetyltransferase [Sutcliffiella rhizosphaerae]CAG9621800.1 hypothetical protein BACCIP111883_02573 [Sutcliffiella rhizosphaerae]
MIQQTIKKPSRDTINMVAEFIAIKNNMAEQHIGFCGKNHEEIAATLKENLTDIPYEQSFLLALHDNKLIGVIGFDADLHNNSAEIIGPFMEEAISPEALYTELTKLLPENIVSVAMFPDKNNKKVKDLASLLNFEKKSEQAILSMNSKTTKMEKFSLTELTPPLYDEMKSLHDSSFPNTYYSGQEIIDRMNDNRKVFIFEKDQKLAGYIYAETEPAFGEASIEFFAVNPSFQNKGIGATLLKGAVQWIFSFPSIDSLQLCVNASNKKALKLYQKIGFSLDHELDYYIKNKNPE